MEYLDALEVLLSWLIRDDAGGVVYAAKQFEVLAELEAILPEERAILCSLLRELDELRHGRGGNDE